MTSERSVSDYLPRISIEKLQAFMKRVCQLRTASLGRISKVMGYKGKSAVASYVRAAENIGIIQAEDEDVNLTDKGEDFCRNANNQRTIVAQFLSNSDGLGQLTDALKLEGAILEIEEVLDCIKLFVEKEQDAKSLVNNVIDWYEFAGLIRRGDDHLHSLIPETDLKYEVEQIFSRIALDDSIYSKLLEWDFADKTSDSPYSYSSIISNYTQFKEADPDDAESKMMDTLSGIFQILGFIVQRRNGPREQGSLKFGSQGDDLLARLPIFTVGASSKVAGFALACELKRSQANKKAVSQALTFSNVVRDEYPGEVVIPVVISDSSRYCNEVAARYANTSNVIHIPLDFFHELLDSQLSRFEDGERLILPTDVLACLSTFIEAKSFEPRLDDLLLSIDSRSSSED